MPDFDSTPYDFDRDAYDQGYIDASDATNTPNVVVKNPHARKIINTALVAFGVTLGAATVFDIASDAVDWSQYTLPAFAVYTFVAGAFGVGVINANIPKA